ncbi:PH domain-containing protein [Oceanobacillus sp. FSL W7-1281]
MGRSQQAVSGIFIAMITTTILQNVTVETAGTIDLNLEIKFTIGGQSISVDIEKKEGADLYKSLVTISHIQDSDGRVKSYAKDSLDLSKTIFTDNRF